MSRVGMGFNPSPFVGFRVSRCSLIAPFLSEPANIHLRTCSAVWSYRFMEPQISPREVVYENPYQRIYRVVVALEHHRKEVYVLDCGQRVGVVILRGEEVLLIRQYRLLVDGMAWEIPGGKVDAGETPETAARREALEEAGVRCASLEPLLYFHPGLDTCDNPTFMFLANSFEELPFASRDMVEVAERVWVPLGQCVRMVFSGAIVDSLTVAALLALYIRMTQPALASP